MKAQNVKLADGKVLKTCGSVPLKIQFGCLSYDGVFFIL